MGHGKKLRNPIYADKWYVFDLFGEQAYADIGLCLVGAAPSKRAVETPLPKLERTIARRSPLMTIRSTGFTRVYFAELDQPIDKRYYEHVLAEYPDATFHLPKAGSASNPITIKSEGRIVGAVMCMKVYAGSLETSESPETEEITV